MKLTLTEAEKDSIADNYCLSCPLFDADTDMTQIVSGVYTWEKWQTILCCLHCKVTLILLVKKRDLTQYHHFTKDGDK